MDPLGRNMQHQINRANNFVLFNKNVLDSKLSLNRLINTYLNPYKTQISS